MELYETLQDAVQGEGLADLLGTLCNLLLHDTEAEDLDPRDLEAAQGLQAVLDRLVAANAAG